MESKVKLFDIFSAIECSSVLDKIKEHGHFQNYFKYLKLIVSNYMVCLLPNILNSKGL